MSRSAEYLFEDMPEAKPLPQHSVESRMAAFTELAKARGGLLPRSAVAEVLGVNRSRVGQLCDEGKLEVVNFMGVHFVTGRSLADYREHHQTVTGRGNKLSRWQSVKISWELGTSIGDVLMAE